MIQEGPAPVHGETIFETRIPSQLCLKTPLAIRIASELLSRHLISHADRERVEIAFEEAIKNAMVHGNRENPVLTISARVFQGGDGWGVLIQDQGRGFSEKTIPDPDGPGFPWLDHGRGILLMRHLFNSVEHYCGGRQVVLWKKCAVARTAPVPRRVQAASVPGVEISRTGDAVLARITSLTSEEQHVDAVFREVQTTLELDGQKLLVLDMTGVGYMSSHAIGRLVALSKACLRVNTKLRLAGVGEELDKVLSQMRIDALFPRFKRVEDAVAAK